MAFRVTDNWSRPDADTVLLDFAVQLREFVASQCIFCKTGTTAEHEQTWAVVSVRSSSWCLSLVTDPPIEVIIRVLRKLAALFPLVVFHVEITSTR